MTAKLFARAIGIVACVVAFAATGEAEAGRCHRRGASSCCPPPCCAPAPICCETVMAPSCCEPACGTVAHYDSCGRVHYHRVGCCETLVTSTIVVSPAPCCASTAEPAAVASVASTPSTSVVKTVSTAARK